MDRIIFPGSSRQLYTFLLLSHPFQTSALAVLATRPLQPLSCGPKWVCLWDLETNSSLPTRTSYPARGSDCLHSCCCCTSFSPTRRTMWILVRIKRDGLGGVYIIPVILKKKGAWWYFSGSLNTPLLLVVPYDFWQLIQVQLKWLRFSQVSYKVVYRRISKLLLPFHFSSSLVVSAFTEASVNRHLLG